MFFLKIKQKRGVASLVSVLIIANIFILAGLMIINFGIIDNISTLSEIDSKKSFFAAETGAYEALLRVAKNKDYQTALDSNCASVQPPCQSGWCKMDFFEGTACVSVSGISPSKIINSDGYFGGKQRKIRIDVLMDATNYGKIISKSWRELDN